MLSKPDGAERGVNKWSLRNTFGGLLRLFQKFGIKVSLLAVAKAALIVAHDVRLLPATAQIA
jgi:hypothetical protein